MEQFRTPLPLISERHKVVLLTNGKCGGTSMKRWFLEQTMYPSRPAHFLATARAFGLGFAYDYHFGRMRIPARGLRDDAQVRRLSNHYARRVSTRLCERARRKEYFKVMVVRDPVSRCLSGYLDKFCGDDLVKPWAQEVVQAVGKGGMISFRDFVTYLVNTDNDTVNGHWRRQSYIAEPFGKSVNCVRLEHLNDDLAALDHPLFSNPDKMPPRLNTNARHGKAGAPSPVSDLSDVANTDLMQMAKETGKLPTKSAFLNDDLVASIRRVYAADYAYLPYR